MSYADGFWYVCVKPGCNEIPFCVSQLDLDDGEGQVDCEICGEICEETVAVEILLILQQIQPDGKPAT